MLHSDPKASPPLEEAGFVVGFPKEAIFVLEKEDVVPGVAEVVLEANADGVL